MDNPNSIFGYKNVDYDTIVNLPLKTGMFLVLVFLIGIFLLMFLKFNLIAGIVIFAIIGPLALLLLTPLDTLVYNLITPTLSKYDQSFITKYLFSRIKTINNNIVTTMDEKITVIKVYSGTYFDQPDEIREFIKEEFNSLIIYNSNYIPKIIFRVINKKLNIKNYFDYFTVKNSDVLSQNIIYDEYYKNFTKEYIDITSSVDDFDYYIELRFPAKTKDSAITTPVQQFYNQLVTSRFNISTERMPEFLTGEEIYTYLKDLTVSPGYETSAKLPIISDF